MLPVILFVSLFVVGSYAEPPKKIVHLPIPKAVTKLKPLRQDKHVEHHQEVPIKRTEVRRVIQKVPLVKEVPLYIYKNKPFYQPRIVPRPILVHEVVGLPIIHDKHVMQPVYIDKPYVVTKTNYVDQPYPVHKPVPIDFVKKVTKIYDRKVEVPHEVRIPLVKTVDRPRPVPYTREVIQHYDVHVNVPRPRPVKVFQHKTHVEHVPFETPNVIVQKRPVYHDIKEFIPKVPQVHVQKFRVPSKQGFHGRVVAGSSADRAATREANRFGPRSGGRVVSVRQGPAQGVIGPRVRPAPRVLAQEFFDGRSGQTIGAAGARGRGGGRRGGSRGRILGPAGPSRVVPGGRNVGRAFLISQRAEGAGVGGIGAGAVGAGALGVGTGAFGLGAGVVNAGLIGGVGIDGVIGGGSGGIIPGPGFKKGL